MLTPPPVIALLFTTFPKVSESFLQRDVAALRARGVDLQLYSLWGGGGDFAGLPVRRFAKWRIIVVLIFILPWNCLRRPMLIRELCRGLIARRAPSWLNFWENMLGAAFAAAHYKKFRRLRPTLVHAAWAGAPATAAWLLWRMIDTPYSCGAHAYDIYEHGGDWWLTEKLAAARFVHTSTDTARRHLIMRGVLITKIHVIRRGLLEMPPLKPLRTPRRPLRIICVARLVAKKGLDLQLAIYAALRDSSLPFEARIVGGGSLHSELKRQIQQLGLSGHVQLLGQRPQTEIATHLAWADVLVHTGIVTASGDRDGLPNVIPEAMAAGVLVLTSPVAATTEAVQAGDTGMVADPAQSALWVEALHRLADDDDWAERLRRSARAWVEQNYDAHHNMASLHSLFEKAACDEV